mmetsp:Transcript_23627/g.42453  ORF Transcript_23627/g.42453 Transcript_23627/m.42453 type:complete len:96 (-) Transcript_23627:1447-1734(-)
MMLIVNTVSATGGNRRSSIPDTSFFTVGEPTVSHFVAAAVGCTSATSEIFLTSSSRLTIMVLVIFYSLLNLISPPQAVMFRFKNLERLNHDLNNS